MDPSYRYVTDLDDTVEHWLPGVVSGDGNDGSKITVRQLLQHTSGLFDYTADFPQFAGKAGYQANRYTTWTAEAQQLAAQERLVEAAQIGRRTDHGARRTRGRATRPDRHRHSCPRRIHDRDQAADLIVREMSSVYISRGLRVRIAHRFTRSQRCALTALLAPPSKRT
ncbi:beta-lactamase family protein [Streptomyces sp. K1PN6]|uniref:Beta-lactamase family protein n=1 Tax=Streptomyces acidicola TaxID=2596892 RepID=A0A5N8X3P3_9ACTN|nr:beta-lactamase family protein [Streptomyces acidicola]